MQKIYLYAIRLDDSVLNIRRFMERNPDYVAGKPCYYIGASIYEPTKRFQMHKEGKRSSRWVRKYGLYVAYRKCHRIEVPNSEERAAAECDYADEMRSMGYGIWQN